MFRDEKSQKVVNIPQSLIVFEQFQLQNDINCTILLSSRVESLWLKIILRAVCFGAGLFLLFWPLFFPYGERRSQKENPRNRKKHRNLLDVDFIFGMITMLLKRVNILLRVLW